MIHKLYSTDTNALLSKPETGMGYQIIEATRVGSNTREKFCVYNGQLIIDLDSSFKRNKELAFTKNFSAILNESNLLNINTSSIQVLSKKSFINLSENLIPRIKLMSETDKKNKKRNSGGKGAIDNSKEFANGIEVFVRISAYEDDKRIDFVNKKLKEGSYTTTEQDYKDCYSTNDDPVDRYALPNDEKIKWAFYIKPKNTNTLQRGIVQPDFGHDGGGIETYFENGTSDGTYLEKRDYGK